MVWLAVGSGGSGRNHCCLRLCLVPDVGWACGAVVCRWVIHWFVVLLVPGCLGSHWAWGLAGWCWAVRPLGAVGLWFCSVLFRSTLVGWGCGLVSWVGVGVENATGAGLL